jgi:hypothetical protein
MSGYKERESQSIQALTKQLTDKIESLPIFRSDQSIAKVQITFAVSEVLDKLALVEWADQQPLLSIEHAALENLQKEKLEDQTVEASAA